MAPEDKTGGGVLGFPALTANLPGSGIPWLGFVVYPTHRLLKRRNAVAFTRRLDQPRALRRHLGAARTGVRHAPDPGTEAACGGSLPRAPSRVGVIRETEFRAAKRGKNATTPENPDRGTEGRDDPRSERHSAQSQGEGQTNRRARTGEPYPPPLNPRAPGLQDYSLLSTK